MEQIRNITKSRGLSAAALKWIAIVTMLLDHIGAAVLDGLFMESRELSSAVLLILYYALRVIGRLAFPIFCFLLIEGLIHTRSRWRYFLRLALFAVLSEIPFDLAFQRTWWSLGYQNVFLTLALGLCAAAAWDWLTKGNAPDCAPLRGLAAVLTAAVAVLAADWLKSDYGAWGVALILVMYLLRDKPWGRDLLSLAVLCAMVLAANSHWIEILGALSFPLLHLYNGQRGRQNKYFFYVFYPAHLLFLAGVLALIVRFALG